MSHTNSGRAPEISLSKPAVSTAPVHTVQSSVYTAALPANLTTIGDDDRAALSSLASSGFPESLAPASQRLSESSGSKMDGSLETSPSSTSLFCQVHYRKVRGAPNENGVNSFSDSPAPVSWLSEISEGGSCQLTPALDVFTRSSEVLLGDCSKLGVLSRVFDYTQSHVVITLCLGFHPIHLFRGLW